jgi:hypothetical protein
MGKRVRALDDWYYTPNIGFIPDGLALSAGVDAAIGSSEGNGSPRG